MKHIVRTYNKDYKCVYENHHRTAESAYEEYIENIRLIKKCIRKGEQFTVARVNNGEIMTLETIKG